MKREIHAPTGTELTCKNWLIEAAYRMIQNNLDADVAFDPDNLIVYGGRGRAARNWECYDAILQSLRELNEDETLLIQSGKPVGVFKSHTDAPRVLLANSNIVPHWATQEQFRYRHVWSVGDLVVWDNTATLHRATPYPAGSGRLLHRTKLAGEEFIA